MNAIILFFVIIGLTSCITYRDISRNTELTEKTIREKVRPGKVYHVHLKSGQVLTIKVTSIDATNVYGIEKAKIDGRSERHSFTESYENLHKNANQLSMKKFNPWLTTALVVAPPALLYGFVSQSCCAGKMKWQ